MDSGRNFKITRAILVMAAILMSVVIGSVGVSHNQNPSTEKRPETIAKLSKQPVSHTSNQPGKQPQSISASLTAVPQPKAVKLKDSGAVVHKSGALTEDEVWTNENTYVSEEPVTVPEGKMLTIMPGTVVKSAHQGSVITVEAGGTLAIAGTQDAPVVITSSNDDTVGDDVIVGSTTAQPADYATAVTARSGSKVAIQHAQILYAATAFVLANDANITDSTIQSSLMAFLMEGGQAKLTNISVDSAETGVTVTSGVVTFQGSMTNITNKNIQACDWGVESCAVSATYLNIASDMLGTVPVCGQVTLISSPSGSLDVPLKAVNCESTTPAVTDMANPTT